MWLALRLLWFFATIVVGVTTIVGDCDNCEHCDNCDHIRGLGLGLGFLGWSFHVMGFGDCGVGPLNIEE